MSRLPHLSRQRGVAVVTALLLTTLAITIIASLFWQQQVQVRSIENQRLQLQKQWILRGALDWTRLILREDFKHSTVDHLGEPWAVALAETRLDEYVENGSANTDVPDAALSGAIIDAQSRFNLTNLCPDGTIDKNAVATFARLLTNVQLSPSLAQATAELMASAQAAKSGSSGGSSSLGESQPMNILQVEDLLAVPGFTPEMLDKLKDFVVVLPRRTGVNVNTAPAEVLAAVIDTLTVSDAAALVVGREKAYFTSVSDFTRRLEKPISSGSGQISVLTNYFLIYGNVRLNRAAMNMQALIERNGTTTVVRWIRES